MFVIDCKTYTCLGRATQKLLTFNPVANNTRPAQALTIVYCSLNPTFNETQFFLNNNNNDAINK